MELDTARNRAEQEQHAAARRLVQVEQEGQAALEQQKVAHEEEVSRLQESWVGGGCGWGMGEAGSLSFVRTRPADCWSRNCCSEEWNLVTLVKI